MKTFELKTVVTQFARERAVKVDKLNRPSETIPLFAAIYDTLDATQEHAVLLALDCSKACIGYKVISSGTMDSCNMDPKVVFRAALLLGAYSIVIAHNHPCEDPTPSGADIAATEMLADAGRILGMAVEEHFVFCSEKSYTGIMHYEH